MYKIYVDCKKNTCDKIKKGEPKILGFDFFEEDSKIEETVAFIKEQLKENGVPLIQIRIRRVGLVYAFFVKLLNSKLTKEHITECIKGSDLCRSR